MSDSAGRGLSGVYRRGKRLIARCAGNGEHPCPPDCHVCYPDPDECAGGVCDAYSLTMCQRHEDEMFVSAPARGPSDG